MRQVAIFFSFTEVSRVIINNYYFVDKITQWGGLERIILGVEGKKTVLS